MKTFSKKLEYLFLVKSIKIETQHFHKKLRCQKPVLKQIGYGVEKGSITKNAVLPVTSLFLKNFVSSTFCKHWSFV